MMNANAAPVSGFPASPSASAPAAFQFRGEGVSIRADEAARALPPGTGADLGVRLTQAFADAPSGAIVAGAMPFLPADKDALWLAEPALPGLPPQPAPAAAAAGWDLTPRPSGAEYVAAVRQVLDRIAAGAAQDCGLKKVVLARSLLARTPGAIDLSGVLDRLSADPAAMAFLLRLPSGGAPRHLIGATPELLLRKTGARIASHPLAGSARRSADPTADRAAAEALAGSGKDRAEHRFVVDHILDSLTPLCRSLSCPRGTGLTSTRSMWHLGTGIEGVLRDADTPSALLAARLHPTPAVCGTPPALAMQTIAGLEPGTRGYYAGAVGWTDAAGDGAWFVAIRCAEVTQTPGGGAEARLYAGAGIVAGSDPAAERAETAAKFAALLSGLGIEGAADL